jgi:hypothetical protein
MLHDNHRSEDGRSSSTVGDPAGRSNPATSIAHHGPRTLHHA